MKLIFFLNYRRMYCKFGLYLIMLKKIIWYLENDLFKLK